MFSVASDMWDLDHEFAWMSEISIARRRARHLPGAPGRLQPRTVARVDRPRRGGQPARRLARAPGGGQADVADGRVPVRHPPVRPPPRLSGDRPPAARRAGGEAAHAGGTGRHPRRGARHPAASSSSCGGTCTSCSRSAIRPTTSRHPSGASPRWPTAQRRPVDEVLYDLMLQRDGRELLYLPLLDYSACNLDAVREMLVHPATVLGLGDGGAHCGVLCDASLPTFMLTHWARDRSRGEKLPVETVVHLQTRRTAELYGFRDRGLLAPGYLADLNIVDHDALRARVARDGLRPSGTGQAPRAARRVATRRRSSQASWCASTTRRRGSCRGGSCAARSPSPWRLVEFGRPTDRR